MKVLSELDVIVDGLAERLEPLIADSAASKKGFLIGIREIVEYLGFEYRRGISRRIVNWYRKYGFPMNKNPQGVWWTTKSLIDKWMQSRELMMRTGRELGFSLPHENYRDGKMRDVNPEKLSQREKDAIVVEIKERRAQAIMKHTTQH